MNNLSTNREYPIWFEIKTFLNRGFRFEVLSPDDLENEGVAGDVFPESEYLSFCRINGIVYTELRTHLNQLANDYDHEVESMQFLHPDGLVKLINIRIERIKALKKKFDSVINNDQKYPWKKIGTLTYCRRVSADAWEDEDIDNYDIPYNFYRSESLKWIHKFISIIDKLHLRSLKLATNEIESPSTGDDMKLLQSHSNNPSILNCTISGLVLNTSLRNEGQLKSIYQYLVVEKLIDQNIQSEFLKANNGGYLETPINWIGEKKLDLCAFAKTMVELSFWKGFHDKVPWSRLQKIFRFQGQPLPANIKSSFGGDLKKHHIYLKISDFAHPSLVRS